MRVEWDDANEVNQAKLGISFEEASELFTSGADDLEVFDEEHCIDDDRFIRIGLITRGVVLVVNIEPEDELMRISSARWATPKEEELFANHMKGRGP